MDRINASNSYSMNHALRAYTQSPQRVARVQAPPSITRAQGISQVTKTTPHDPIAKIGTPKPVAPSADPSRLVAAKVNPIDLRNDVATIQGPKPVMTSSGTYSIHPNASATNTAATGIALGRGIDLRG